VSEFRAVCEGVVRLKEIILAFLVINLIKLYNVIVVPLLL